MGLQYLFHAWAVPYNQGIRDARDGHRDDSAKLFNTELDPLLAQSESLSTSLVGPDTRQNESKSRKNALLSAFRAGRSGRMAFVTLVPSSRRGKGTHCNLCSLGQIRHVCWNVIAPVCVYLLLKHCLDFLALTV